MELVLGGKAIDYQFADISSEQERCYIFEGGGEVKIELPTHLHVAKSGGHRILDACGTSHYIPWGWIHLCWIVKDRQPNFVA